mgnify:CR=1 FL=1
MDDVTLSRFIDAITKQTASTTEVLEGQDKINTALTAQIDVMMSTLSDTKKKKSTLETKIGKLSDSSSKVEAQFGKLNKTLGGVAEAIKQTNKLTTDQTKILQNLDPGSRRLKGDTYDAQTGSEKRLTKAINNMSRGGMGITKGLVTAGGAMGGYKLLSFLMRNRLLLGGLGLGSLLDPNYLKSKLGMGGSDMSWGEGLFGPGSIINSPTMHKGADWMSANPYKSAGLGAYGLNVLGARTGTNWALKQGLKMPGRLGRGAGGAMAWALTDAGRAAGARGAGYAAPMVPRITSFAGTAGRWGRGVTGEKLGGRYATAATAKTADGFRKVWHDIKGNSQMSKRAKNAMKVAMKKGATPTIAKRIGALVAARLIAGLAIAGGTGGVGSGVSLALWGWTIIEIAEMIQDPVADFIGDWWYGSEAENLAKAQTNLETGAIEAQAAGINITGDKGKFLSKEKIKEQLVKGIPYSETVNMGRDFGYKKKTITKWRLTEKEKAKNAAIDKWAATVDGDFERTILMQGENKHRWIKKIMAVSDGTEFIGRPWTARELFDATTSTGIREFYQQVVLPRATSKPEAEIIRKAKNIDFEKGGIKGSSAELTPQQKKSREAASLGLSNTEYTKLLDDAKTTEANNEMLWRGFGGGRHENVGGYFENYGKAMIQSDTSNTDRVVTAINQLRVTNNNQNPPGNDEVSISEGVNTDNRPKRSSYRQHTQGGRN